MTAITEDLLDSLFPFLSERRAALDAFERVSIHAPVARIHASVTAVAEKLVALASDFDTVVHPDAYIGERSLLGLGGRVVFENMDSQKGFGRNTADLASVFEAYPEASFCLDVAHGWTNDPSLRLGHHLIDRFGHRLRQLHVSGIEPDGTHRATTRADLNLLCACTRTLQARSLATGSGTRGLADEAPRCSRSACSRSSARSSPGG